MDTALPRLYTATFLFVLLMAVGFPLVPQHLSLSFAAPVWVIGFQMGIHGIMQIVLRLPMGDMADRKGRRNSLVLTFLLTIFAGCFYVFGTNAWWILPGQALFGLASGIFWVAANAYLFDRVTPEEVPKATSDYAIAIGAAFLVGPPLGGWLADTYGFEVGLSVFIWASVLGMFLVMTLPETPPARDAQRPPGGVHQRAWRIFQNPDIRVSALGTLAFSLLFGTVGAFYPVLLRDLTFTAFIVGILMAVRQGTGLLVRIGLPQLLERLGPRKVLLAGLVPAALTVALVPLPGSSLVGHLVLMGVAGAAFGVMVPANLTLVSRGSPPNEKGLANGIYGTALGLGTAGASWIMGGVGSATGLGPVFVLASVLALAGAFYIHLYARGHPTHPAERAPEAPEEPAGG